MKTIASGTLQAVSPIVHGAASDLPGSGLGLFRQWLHKATDRDHNAVHGVADVILVAADLLHDRGEQAIEIET
jgi:hypothetical protein